MAFIDWLRKQHEESERNRRLFENRPGTLRVGEVPTHEMVRASRAWGGGPGSGSGYQDRPGGQNLMVRQPRFGQPPPTSVTLTEGDDGSRKKVTKWEPDKQEKRLKATALPRDTSPTNMQPIGPNYTGPWGTGERIPAHVPRMRGDIGATESIGVADPDPRYRGMQPSLANVGTPNILQRFLQGRQSIADRIERNRIERLMRYRTRNPYFPTGGRY